MKQLKEGLLGGKASLKIRFEADYKFKVSFPIFITGYEGLWEKVRQQIDFIKYPVRDNINKWNK